MTEILESNLYRNSSGCFSETGTCFITPFDTATYGFGETESINKFQDCKNLERKC